MRIYDESDYKEALKGRMDELKSGRPGLSWRKVALAVPMQYTFLSRVLNHPNAHLSEDQLHAICKHLELYVDEVDFLFLLRSVALTEREDRREELQGRIGKERARHLTSASIQDSTRSEFDLGMKYLLEPLHLFVHLGLQIPAYRKDPRSLCGHLGLSVPGLQEMLLNLHKQGHIELGDSPFEVKRINQHPIHFGPEHPITRVHQNLLKTLASAQLMRTPEKEKRSIQILFAANPSAYEEIRDQFDRFLQKAEKIAVPAPSRAVYQMSFDLFRWFS